MRTDTGELWQWGFYPHADGVFLATRVEPMPPTVEIWRHMGGRTWERFPVKAALDPETYPGEDDSTGFVTVVEVATS